MKIPTIVTYIYEHYNFLDVSLSLDFNMIIYCTREIHDIVKETRLNYDKNNEKTKIFIAEINELEIYLQHQNIINHKKIDKDVYISFNKLSFIRSVAKTNPFKTRHFLWCEPKNLRKLNNLEIQKYLTDKIVHLEDFFIIPQNLAWHYRYLIDKEFYSIILKNEIPNEKLIYEIIQKNNQDLIGYNKNQISQENKNTKDINQKMLAVIARYNEDVSWVELLNCNYIIYNKNEIDSILFENNLPNVGREGHTFFTYIIENYENLPDYICFLHGVPFDHCLDIINKINNFNMTEKFLPLSSSYILANWEWEKTYALADELGLKYSKPLKMISSCQSIVSKELILKTTKEMYKKLLEELSYHFNPHQAYIIENLWPTIFNFNQELNPSCDNCRGYWAGC